MSPHALDAQRDTPTALSMWNPFLISLYKHGIEIGLRNPWDINADMHSVVSIVLKYAIVFQHPAWILVGVYKIVQYFMWKSCLIDVGYIPEKNPCSR